MTTTLTDSVIITNECLHVQVPTANGAEVWTVESHELAAVPGGIALGSVTARRPTGEVVCLACSPCTPAGTVDDVVVCGLIDYGD